MISFCTTCKGRLWQLKQTLPVNTKFLSKTVQWVILDYQSPDNLKEYLEEHYKEFLDDGRIKYFRLIDNYNFHNAYAKNIAHRLSTGTILFNLDADNFITKQTIEDLKTLTNKEIYLPKQRWSMNGVYGRVGYTRDCFYMLKGYNENILGGGPDDSELRIRAFRTPLKVKVSKEVIQAIQNENADKVKYNQVNGLIDPPFDWPQSFGVANVVNRDGKVIELK